jgi:hypothetical protein
VFPDGWASWVCVGGWCSHVTLCPWCCSGATAECPCCREHTLRNAATEGDAAARVRGGLASSFDRASAFGLRGRSTASARWSLNRHVALTPPRGGIGGGVCCIGPGCYARTAQLAACSLILQRGSGGFLSLGRGEQTETREQKETREKERARGREREGEQRERRVGGHFLRYPLERPEIRSLNSIYIY